MKIIKPIIIGLIPLVIGTFLGSYLETKRAQNDQNTRYLYLETSFSSDILYRPNITSGNLEITLDGKPISNLSLISVYLYNASDHAYQDIPVYIELIPNNGETINVISEDVSGAYGLRETVTPIQGLLPSDIPGAIRYGYYIKTVNRLDEVPVFGVTYIILGSQEPMINVNIDKIGILLAEYDYSSLIYRLYYPWWKVYWPIIVLVVLLIAIIVFSIINMIVLPPKQFRKNIAKDRQYFEKAYDEAITKLGEKPNPKEFALYIRATIFRYVWEDMPKINKLILKWDQPIEPESESVKST